ncbi:M16 family metallopeptidase [Pedobacter changchengzhani]|nr:pitrilysin family protein [Pedobacter changchengzhani]
MKRYLLLINFILLFATAQAQIKAISFNVNGLKVILKPTQKETVSMCMFFRGGVMNYEPEQAGIEHLALTAAGVCGTKNYTVTDYQELADEYGIRINGGATTDFGLLSMNCISKYLDQGWKLFSDAVANPIFDENEFATTKEKLLTGISHSKSDPETRLDQLTMETLFKGTQYGVNPLGDIITVSGFTADSVKKYYHNQLLNKNRMFLVVAGKITKEELEKKIVESFKNLPKKPYTAPVYEQNEIVGQTVFSEPRNIATNYISVVFNAPVMSSADYHSFVLLVNVLSGSLSYELRTKQGLSYDPGAKVIDIQKPYTSLFVSSTQPGKALKAMFGVFDDVGKAHYNQKYLDALKKDHRDKSYRNQESANAIVANLGKAEILGDYKMEENMVENFNKVTLKDMNDVYTKYFKGSDLFYIGDEDLLNSIFKK